MAHGSLLVNLASPEGRIRNSSVSSLLADLKVAAEVGLDAVCFHVGYAKGHPSAEDAALILATRKLGEMIARMPRRRRPLENLEAAGSARPFPSWRGFSATWGAAPSSSAC